MATTTLSKGTVHKLPSDMHKSLSASKRVATLWESLTPLARNEFICWVESAKQTATRERRITRTVEELLAGQRRPCCWMGCIHRPDKPLSPSVKWVIGKQRKNSR